MTRKNCGRILISQLRFDAIRSIDDRIRKIKHARNVFNTTTLLPEENITVDEALVLMATLNNNYGYFADLGNRQPKTRNRTQYKGEIEYTYTNYNIEEAKKLGRDMYERILELQSKLTLSTAHIILILICKLIFRDMNIFRNIKCVY